MFILPLIDKSLNGLAIELGRSLTLPGISQPFIRTVVVIEGNREIKQSNNCG